jgi:toxin ParE1/3/4
MAHGARKEVKVSAQFDIDIIEIYSFGEEVFGPVTAKSLVADIYSRIWSLDQMHFLHPECRHLPTKDKRYRNIIIGSYLIIYRITSGTVEVLRILHSRSSIRKIRTSRKVFKK